MEIWFIYAFASSIFMGLYTFIQKISAEKNHNSANTTMYSMLTTAILGFIYIIITKQLLDNIIPVLILSLINMGFYYISVITRLEALKSVPATIFFPYTK